MECDFFEILGAWLRGYKLLMLNSAGHEISTVHKTKMLNIKTAHAFKLSDVVFIIKSSLNFILIYEQGKCHAQLSRVLKKLYNRRA